MKLTTEQANVISDYLDGLNFAGDVCDDIVEDSTGIERRYILPTPTFCFFAPFQDHYPLRYCVVRFHALNAPFYTHISYYPGYVEASIDNADFPYSGG